MKSSSIPGYYPLYFVTDHDLNGGRTKLWVIEEALKGGLKLIQFRDKVLSDVDFEAEALSALELCKHHHATLIVNDRVEIAHRIGAHGVHLGQEDMHPRTAREILGEGATIGLSTHNEKEIMAANQFPLTYINIGPLFPTQTKEHLQTLGMEEVLRLSKISAFPWTTMGGIKKHHLSDLFERGVKTVGMVTEISLAQQVGKVVQELLTEIITAH